MSVNVLFPQLGESVVKGTILKWHVRVGDMVKKDQTLVEVSTDKADNEVPSPVGGKVVQLLAAEGDDVAVNAQIAVIDTDGTATAPSPSASADDRKAFDAIGSSTPSAMITVPSIDPQPVSPGGPTSPAVRRLAGEHGVDLNAVRGSGENGRVTRQDVERHVERAATAPPSAPSNPSPALHATRPVVVDSPPPARPSIAPAAFAPSGAFTPPPFVQQPGDEIVPFNRRRRIIADHMVYSKHVAPHVMTIAEIDMHRTHRLREQHKTALKAEGIGLTFLSFIAAATVRALRENPVMNARVLDDAFVKLKRINLGIAVETPQGLVVPVIRDADALTVRGLARAIDQTAAKARDNKITVDDLAGATFTISNPGLKGNFVGAAIISQPNVGILRIGEIVKRTVVIEVDGQDTIAIHPVMFAALSYDHRIVDGVAANNFLHRVTEILETAAFEI